MILTTAAVVTAMLAPTGDRADCPRPLERTYSRHYRRVARRHGKRAPGRNIRKHGVRFRGHGFDAVCSELRRSDRQLHQLLKSPPYSHSKAVPPPQPPAGVRSDETVSVGGSSNPMVNPYCESRRQPAGRVDPSGKYWGWYQFDYSTWVAHGGAPGGYGNAPLYLQHQVAARVELRRLAELLMAGSVGWVFIAFVAIVCIYATVLIYLDHRAAPMTGAIVLASILLLWVAILLFIKARREYQRGMEDFDRALTGDPRQRAHERWVWDEEEIVFEVYTPGAAQRQRPHRRGRPPTRPMIDLGLSGETWLAIMGIIVVIGAVLLINHYQ